MGNDPVLDGLLRTILEPRMADPNPTPVPAPLVCASCGCQHFLPLFRKPLPDGRVHCVLRCRYCGRTVTRVEAAPSPPTP